MAAPAKPSASEATFESALTRLEAIVEEMESGKMPLEELLVRYEEGMKLVNVCQDRLTRAEKKIEIISRDAAGKTTVKNFIPEETPVTASPTETKDNDDVSLF